MSSTPILRELYSKNQDYLKEIKDLEEKTIVDGKINIEAYNRLQFL